MEDLEKHLDESFNLTGERYPRAIVMAVPERGAKNRIVTKSPGSLIALGHWIRP